MAALLKKTWIQKNVLQVQCVFDGSSVQPHQKFTLPRPRTINVEFNLSQGGIILTASPGDVAAGNYAQLPTDVRDNGLNTPSIASVALADRSFYHYEFFATGSPIGTVTLLATIEE